MPLGAYCTFFNDLQGSRRIFTWVLQNLPKRDLAFADRLQKFLRNLIRSCMVKESRKVYNGGSSRILSRWCRISVDSH